MSDKNNTDIRFSLLELDPLPDAGSAAAEWDNAPKTTPNAPEPIFKSSGHFRRSANHPNVDSVVAAMPEFSSKVAMEPIYTGDGLEIPGQNVTIRTYPDGRREALGVVGRRYKVVQDERLVRIMRALEGSLDTFDGGRYQGKIWMYGQNGTTFERDIVPGDSVQARAMIANSHDGSIPFCLGLPVVRPVCQNTLAMALRGGLHKIRHTRTVEETINLVHEAVERFGMEFIEATDKMRLLAKARCSDDQLKEYTGYVFSKWADDSEDQEDAKESRVYAKVLENFQAGQGAEYHRGTLWGAYNAVTEYTSHQRSRGEEDSSRRFVDLNFGAGASINKRAFERALEMV